MQPLEDLLHRIRWDGEFGRGTFAIGYYDRVAQQELVVPLAAVSVDSQDRGTFSLQDEDGVVRHIPLHRVRTVYKDGVVIWQRPSPAERD